MECDNTFLNDIITDLYDKILFELKKEQNKKNIQNYCVKPILSLIKNYMKLYIYVFYIFILFFVILNSIILFFMFKLFRIIKVHN